MGIQHIMLLLKGFWKVCLFVCACVTLRGRHGRQNDKYGSKHQLSEHCQDSGRLPRRFLDVNFCSYTVSFRPLHPDQDALRKMFGTMARQQRSCLHNNPRIMPGVLNMMPLHHSEGLKRQNPLHENVRGTGILFSDI